MIEIKSEIGREEINTSIELTLTDETFLKITKRRKKLILGAGLLSLTLGILFLLFFDLHSTPYRLLIFLGIIWIVGSFFIERILKKKMTKQILEKHENFSHVYYFNEDGIRIQSETCNCIFKLNAIKTVKLLRRYIFILLKNNTLIIDINKLSAEELHELVSFLSNTTGLDDITKLHILRCYNRLTNSDPEQLDDEWVCMCGNHNSNEILKCNNCGKEKDSVFKICSDSEIINWIEKEKIQNQSIANEQKKKKIKKILKVTSAIILYIVIVIIIYNMRFVHYKSVEDQRTAFAGSWTECGLSENQHGLSIVFDYNTVSKVSLGFAIGYNIKEWNSLDGSVTCERGVSFRMRPDGTITDGKSNYKKDDE